jgi:outer membrane protein TolC
MIIEYAQIPQLVEKSLEMKIQNTELESSKVKISSLAQSFVPEVSLYVKEENSTLNNLKAKPSVGLYTSVNLFNGNKDLELSKISQLNYEAHHLDFEKNYNERVYLAQSKYWEIIKAQENLKILNDYDKINKSNRILILKKVSSGLSPQSEELIFKKIELELQEEIVKSTHELKNLKRELMTVFSLSKNDEIILDGPIDISKFKYEGQTRKIDIELAAKSKDKALLDKKLSELWRMPKINLYAEQSFTTQTNGEVIEAGSSSKQLIGIKMTIPLMSEKNVDTIEEQVKKRELEATYLRSLAIVSEREALEENQVANFNHQKIIIDISKNKVQLTKEIFDKTFQEFRIGLKEAVSLNEATVEYIQAKKDFIDHQVDYILAVEQAKINNRVN